MFLTPLWARQATNDVALGCYDVPISNLSGVQLETLLRQWAMLRFIPRHPRRIDTGRLRAELQKQGYEITLRTIQRDLNKLSAVLPLVCDQSKPQGWWWQADADLLEIPGIDAQAALVFKMAEQHLGQVLPKSTLDALTPWFKAAGGVLQSQMEGAGTWLDKVRIIPRGQPLLPPAVDPAVQAAVVQAVFEGKRLAITYTPHGVPEPKEYEVNPIALVQRDHLLYIVCTLWDYKNPMLLVMHRIRSAMVLEKASYWPEGFDLDDYIHQGGLGYRIGPPIEIDAFISTSVASILIETPLAEDQRLDKLPDSSYRLRATVADTKELRNWLRGFGAAVQLHFPTGFLDL